MSRRSRDETFDVAVVGCGLAGLTAGLHLQRAGCRVLILDRRGVPGGLCGTHLLDGYEFVIACNDFGLGMVREMRALGVEAAFYPSRTRFHFEHSVVDLPPRPGSLLRLLPRLADVARFAGALSRDDECDVASVVEQSIRSPALADVVESVAYPLGIPPGEIPVAALKSEFSGGYGHHRPMAPVGGPGALVERMLERFTRLGGTVKLGSDCLEIGSEARRGGSEKVVITNRGSHSARAVISSRGRWSEYPVDCKPGLAVSVFHLAVDRGLPYPERVHTMVHLPSEIGRWLSQIDRGEWPEVFGFHVFRSDLPRRGEYYPINLYLYLPRGVESPSRQELQGVENYVFEHLDEMWPRASSAVMYRRFISSAEFAALHGLSSRVVQLRPKPGFTKPDIYDPVHDMYHVGNSVLPPGEHAGAAVVSGRRAAEAAMRALSGLSGGRPPSPGGTVAA